MKTKKSKSELFLTALGPVSVLMGGLILKTNQGEARGIMTALPLVLIGLGAGIFREGIGALLKNGIGVKIQKECGKSKSKLGTSAT